MVVVDTGGGQHRDHPLPTTRRCCSLRWHVLSISEEQNCVLMKDCDEMFDLSRLESHQKVCRFRKVRFPGSGLCKMEMTFNKVKEHVIGCRGTDSNKGRSQKNGFIWDFVPNYG